MQADSGSDSGEAAPMQSWLADSYPYCWLAADLKTYACKPPGLLYSASLYHTCLCLFGGLDATPGNGSEMVIGTILMLASGLVWAHVMGTVVEIVTTSGTDGSPASALPRNPPEPSCRLLR